MIYNISDKNLIDIKPLRIRFHKIDGFIRIYNGTRYLVLLGPEKDDAIYKKIRYLMSQKILLHVLFFIIIQEINLILMILYI